MSSILHCFLIRFSFKTQALCSDFCQKVDLWNWCFNFRSGTCRAKLSRFVIELQQIINTVLMQPASFNSMIVPDLPCLLYVSKDIRGGSVNALAAQYQRMIQTRLLLCALGRNTSGSLRNLNTQSTQYFLLTLSKE